MGFIKRVVTNAIVEKVEDIAFAEVAKHMESTRSVDALAKKSKSKYKLFVKKKSLSIKRGFSVLDGSKKQKYLVKMDILTFGCACIRLYDFDGNELGYVVEEKIYRTTKDCMARYVLYLNGEKVGVINRRLSIRIKLDLEFNGWRLESDIWQNHFDGYDENENIIMHIDDAFSSKKTYVIDFHNREYEIIGLLLMMAIELVLHRKD